MTMKDWAENEVKLFCEKINDGYASACAHAALEIYQKFMDQGHTGLSYSCTKSILEKLINDTPLTPIEDLPESWECVCTKGDNIRMYQCIRRSSLFKYVYPDHVEYSDDDMFYCEDIHNKTTYSNNFVEAFVEKSLQLKNIEAAKISFPYYPNTKAIKIRAEDFKYDKTADGDFDTIGIVSAILPDDSEVIINSFFSEGEAGWQRISIQEYMKRRKAAGIKPSTWPSFGE